MRLSRDCEKVTFCSAWDMKAYLAAQKEKDKKVEATLLDILTELRHLYSNHAPQLKPPTQRGNLRGLANLSNHVQPMDTSLVDGKGEGHHHRPTHSAVPPPPPAHVEAEQVTGVIDPIDNMYLVLEGSALIPFFEVSLVQDI